MEESTNIIAEGIKLTRNSRGYTWDIRVKDHDLDKLEKLNKEMIKRFSEEEAI